MLYKPILLCICLLWLISACHKDPEPQLPPITEIGANTLGFKVNGEVWLPSENDVTQPLTASEYVVYQSSQTFAVSAYRKTPRGVPINGFIFGISGLDEVKDYFPLRKKLLLSITYDRYNTDYEQPGKLLITRLDTINKIVSGQFEFWAKHPDTGRFVHITEGRFDVQFGYGF